ncbi:uncharacterized protein LOC133205361 [Saccostrea echinata]|uniref:uncharacterized protein LOC133205361 n=1 Tax=Saccostrea echinata TaxID=191078 RepID=UPI002A82E4D7|nr:uncharacterized protein LOC133205361 [Saccostrea echinata]
MLVVINKLWIISLLISLLDARNRQLDIILGLDASKNTKNEEDFNFQREFFKAVTETIYDQKDVSIRVGVFAYDDTIRLYPKTRIWSDQNSTKTEVIENIESLNYTNGNDNPYLDHALRFVLAIFDDDRAENRERECSEKVLVMVVTDQIKKWSDGSKELVRLKEMGVKPFFIAVGNKGREINLIKTEKYSFFTSFKELNSPNNSKNSSDFIERTLTERIGSCCSSTIPGGQLTDPKCSKHMGNKCNVSCDRFLDTQLVVQGTCETNGVWRHGGRVICKEFEVHPVSVLIGAFSALVAFVLLTLLVVYLCKRKWENKKKADIPSAVQSPTQRSVRNQYSASTAKSSSKDRESASSDDLEIDDDDEEEAQVYDYAQEESLMSLSKRPKTKKKKPQVNHDIQFLKINEIPEQNHNISYPGEVYQNTEFGGCRLLNMSTKSNAPPPCCGPSGYVEYEGEEIYQNNENGHEEEQEVYVNTTF